MLNFGSAQVGGGGGTQYWQEVAEPLFNNDIMLENNNVNGVVAKANNAPASVENIVSTWYDINNDSSCSVIGTIDNGTAKVLFFAQYDFINDNNTLSLDIVGTVQTGVYANNNFSGTFAMYEQGTYFNYHDTTRNLSMACVIQNNFNGNDMGWSVQSNNISGYVFGIDEVGKICTNQIDPTHTHTTPIGSIPIHDTNGVYQGKLLLY